MKKITAIFSITVAAIVFAVAFLPLRAIAGLESPCTYLSDLISTNPLSSDLASTGDDHHRCIKVALKTTFPNISGAVTPTHTELNFVDGVTSAVQTQLDAKLASASYTAADVLSKLLTVDGAGSGLDADLLDTFSSAEFARLSQRSTFTGATVSGTGYSLELESAVPGFLLSETDAVANNQNWNIIANVEQLDFQLVNDALNSGTSWATVQRTNNTVDSINLAATAVQVNGVAIPIFAYGKFGGDCGSFQQIRGASCADGGTGILNITFSPTFTTSAPACTATIAESSAGMIRMDSVTTSTLQIRTFDTAAAAADKAASFICTGT